MPRACDRSMSLSVQVLLFGGAMCQPDIRLTVAARTTIRLRPCRLTRTPAPASKAAVDASTYCPIGRVSPLTPELDSI